MAVSAGLATRVAFLMAMKNSDIGRMGEADNPFYYEQFRENGGPHGEEGHIGMASYCRRGDGVRSLLPALRPRPRIARGDTAHLPAPCAAYRRCDHAHADRSEEHTSELQSLMRISYAV